ncbi:MAG: cation diffusion facilitator family transporter [Actinomycetota bacterium]
MRRTERAAIVAAVVYILLAIAMVLSAVLLVKSVAMFAGGIHTVVRAAACFLVFLGLRLSRRRSADFPLGLYKLENLVGVIVGLLILFGAYEVAKEAVELIGPESEAISDVWIPIMILVICAMLAGMLAWYKWHVGKGENSPSLKAEARHSLGSMCACLLLVLGLGMEEAGVPDMGAVVALLVVALLAWFGVSIALDGLKVLLDASVEKEVLEKVRSIAEGDGRISEVYEVEGRNSGSFRFIDLDLAVATHDLREANAVSRELEERIREEVENVDHITVEFSPETTRSRICAVPLADSGTSLAADLWKAKRLAILAIDPGGDRVAARRTLAIPHEKDMPGREIRLAAFVGMQGVDVLLEGGGRPGEAPAADRASMPCNGQETAMREARDVLSVYGVETFRLTAAMTLDDAEKEALERFSLAAREGGG